jgi:putative Mg2+ transporter-C (MgtC) family protein
MNLMPFAGDVGTAFVLGLVIGIEREMRHHEAGMRTNTLVCLGAALFVSITRLIEPVDSATRIAAQVVSGIGFLGAGTIVHSRGAVVGLTSAATIWVVAGIGLLVGAGFPALGLLATLLVLVTLELLARVEGRILGRCRRAEMSLDFDDARGRARAELVLILAEQNPDLCRYALDTGDGRTRLRLTYCESHPAHHRFLTEVLEVSGGSAR